MKNYFIVFFISLFIVSCNQTTNRSNLLPNSTGKASELLITIDKNKWESSVGDSVRSAFVSEEIALPQPEPIFDVVNIPNSAFSKIFESHRNMIRIKISPQIEKNSITMRKNVWSKPQIVFQINAKNDSAFFDILSRNKTKIVDSILIEENNRYIQSYKRFESPEIKRQLKEKGVLIQIPKGYKMDVNKKDFMWISHETPMISQAFIVAFKEYTDTTQFQKIYIINTIDSILKENVPGALDSSYMTIEHRSKIYYKKMLLNNLFTAKLRGLWSVEGDFMGGPFVMLALPDIKRNRIVYVYAYVYSPKYNKRNYLRQIDAMISTIKILD
ncbi:MAG: DUF4837 family protein [Bacteroidales bacterium]|nr:DUF4837 family protein [Bacteroidales bacterium]